MSPKRFLSITFEPDGVKSKAEEGTRLLDALEATGLTVRSECGGRGVCGKCRIIVKDRSAFSPVTDSEREVLGSELKSGYRLACECSVLGDATVYVPEESRVSSRKMLIEGTERSVVVDPAISKMFIRIPKPSLQDIRSDARRLQDALREIYGVEATSIDYQLLKRLPQTLRKSNWRITVALLDQREIISVEKGDTSDEAYGIAVDIGTSKIIIYFSDLLNGRLIATHSAENPQIKYGEDIISRISYASKSEASLKELHKIVIKSLKDMIVETCRKLALNPHRIYEMTVVGNTAMHHLFLGIEPKHIGLSPYVPAIIDPIDRKARELSLKLNFGANVYVLPLIAGFVGADAVADIISTGIHRSDELSMILDIGTNTEVVIGNKYGLTTCSCASGPAFEGAHLKCGMKAVTGAIERIQIKPEKYHVNYKTIGSIKPIGFCGSAIIDAVAELLKCRLIDKTGRFTDFTLTPKLKKAKGEKSFVLVTKEEGAKRDIVITQKDIREIQLAKAAIYTGCHVLMSKRHVQPKDIRRLYVAGAFGNYLNLENAKLIGMLPDIPLELIMFVGNAAGAGARMALISRKLRKEAASVGRSADYIELASEPNFQTEFTSAMFFPHKDLNRFPSVRSLF